MSNSNSSEPLSCKVVLLGETAVGKTSIISRYTINNFRPSLMSTPGANFTTKKVNFDEEEKTIRFEIWDTAGQERFRSLARAYYQKASACILVYDLTRKETFTELQNYWIPQIKENAPLNASKFYII